MVFWSDVMFVSILLDIFVNCGKPELQEKQPRDEKQYHWQSTREGKNVRLPTVNKLFGQRTNLSIEVKKVAPASSWKTCCIYIAGSYSFFMLFVCFLFSGHHILCIEIFMYHLYMPIRVVHSPRVQFCLAAFLTNLTQMSNKTWHRWTFFNST